MKIKLLQIGNTTSSYLKEGIAEYEKRLKHYISFEIETIPVLKNTKKLSVEQQKEKEGELILQHLKENETIILLDEKGKTFTSPDFATFLQKKMNSGQNIVFIIGGAYGFSPSIYNKSSNKIALSKLTFSHQMVRLFFTEQLYRAFTILKNEHYHH